MRFGLQEISITLIIANVGKDFKDGGADIGSTRALVRYANSKTL